MSQAKIEEIAKKGGKARALQLGHDGFVKLGRKGGKARASYRSQKTIFLQQGILSPNLSNENLSFMKDDEGIFQSLNNLKENPSKHSITKKKLKKNHITVIPKKKRLKTFSDIYLSKIGLSL